MYVYFPTENVCQFGFYFIACGWVAFGLVLLGGYSPRLYKLCMSCGFALISLDCEWNRFPTIFYDV